MADRTYIADSGGDFLRPGWTTLTSGTSESARRDVLGAYGTYEPTLADVGAITDEAILTDGDHDYNADVNTVTIPNGAVITGKRIFGDITFAGTATITDCLLVGGNNLITSGNFGILSCNNTRTGQAVVKDCTIRARKESDGRDGALGRQFELYRCKISNVVDGVGIYNNTGGTSSNVKVKGCYIYDHAYTYPDRDHDDGVHGDGIQFQGGLNVEIIGNTLYGTGHYMTGSDTYYDLFPANDKGDWPLLMPTPRMAGSGLMINGNVNALGASSIVDGNFIHYYKIQTNIGSLANNFVFTNNKFSAVNTPAKNVNGTVRNGVALTFTANEYWIRLNNLTTDNNNITGLTSGGAIANTTNKWRDGGSVGVALNTPRSSGINDNNL